MRCTGILVVLAWAIGCAAAAREPPPEFSYNLYSDKQGHFSFDGAALALVKRPSHLQRVYADAARGEARPKRLIQELEYWFQQTGLAVADRTAALGCLALPELQSNCSPPNWGLIEQFLGNSPEGVRLREVLAEAYARRAHQLGVRNDVTIAGVNLLLVGSLAKAVLARVGVVEARTAAQKSLVPEAKAAKGGGEMLPAAEELLRQAAGRPPELLSGFRIFGHKGLVGPTFQRNVLLIEAQAKGAVPIRQLVGAMEAEARAAGASRLSITGHAVVNQGFLNPATAQRYGFQFRKINESTIELVKELAP